MQRVGVEPGDNIAVNARSARQALQHDRLAYER
jgi:hypothetical protein